MAESLMSTNKMNPKQNILKKRNTAFSVTNVFTTRELIQHIY